MFFAQLTVAEFGADFANHLLLRTALEWGNQDVSDYLILHMKEGNQRKFQLVTDEPSIEYPEDPFHRNWQLQKELNEEIRLVIKKYENKRMELVERDERNRRILEKHKNNDF